jgi:serine/threonine protein kinase
VVAADAYQREAVCPDLGRRRCQLGSVRASAVILPEAVVRDHFPGATAATWRDGGSNGDVYQVVTAAGDRAVKVVQPGLPSDRHGRELDALQAVTSPYVVRHRSHGTISHLGTAYPYIEMDWINGRSLDSALAEVRAWPLAKRIDVLAQICEGIHSMGGARVVHRDLKPLNVMLTADDTPTIVDLGWARNIDGTTITEAWRDTGTLPFNSPEQLRHERTDTRSDIFAAGIIAYLIITGDYPFTPRTMSESIPDLLLAGKATVSLFVDTAMTDELAAVVQRMISAAPAQRPRSGAIAAAELRGALGAGRPSLALFPRPEFLPILGKQKTHLRSGFFSVANAYGVVAPLHVNVANFIQNDLSTVPGTRLVDPSSPLSQTARAFAPASFRSHQLPESFVPAYVKDQKKLDAFIDRYFEVERNAGATVLISPYFNCSPASLDDLEATLVTAEAAQAKADRPMLAGVSLHRTQLQNAALRPAVLDRLTAVDIESFYVLVNDGMTDFRQLDDEALLRGLKDLTQTLRQNRQGVFFGRVGAVGLCLVVAGASGFASGYEAKNLHYAPDAAKQAGGGPPVPRYYEPELLTFLRYNESRAARSRTDPKTKKPPLSNCACVFCVGAPLMGTGSWDEAAARRHFMLSLTNDVHDLRLRSERDRRAWLEERLQTAEAAREALTRSGPSLRGDSVTPTYRVWRDVFVTP